MYSVQGVYVAFRVQGVGPVRVRVLARGAGASASFC